MTLFFFHLHEGAHAGGTSTLDDEGKDMPDLAAARHHAETAARHILCSEVIDGELCLGCHIEIENRENGDRTTVLFRDVVKISE